MLTITFSFNNMSIAKHLLVTPSSLKPTPKLVEWFYNITGRHLIRFLNRVKRLLEFVPVIWNSYDWDHSYATKLFAYQLQRMVNHLEKHKSHVEWQNDVSRIKTALELLERVETDYYLYATVEKVEKKYGPSKLDFIEVSGEGHYSLERTFEKNYSEEELNTIEAEHDRAVQEGTHLQNKAKRVLWKFIEHNIENWWS